MLYIGYSSRIFFGYDRFCSASAMYVCEGIDNFDVMYRKAAWSFMQRLYASKNVVISVVVNSDMGRCSPLRAAWNDALVVH